MRSRIIRDPIHGDVVLGPVQAAVVDTVIFQRLRYIRQNGLLHFVFPGAVHSRFLHSLGTMEVARRVFQKLMARVCGFSNPSESVQYLGAVFELAALLHDVGHCAFSHSIERVRIGDRPLLGTVRELFESWREHDLLAEYLAEKPKEADAPASHEAIGLILVGRIFAEDAVSAACREHLSAASEDVGRDVRALMNDSLECSAKFRHCAEELAALVKRAATAHPMYEQVDPDRFAGDLQRLLHSLVSGTLDVDRLDYLNRDSFFCGVSYGKCDLGVLLNALDLGGVEGETQLLLHEKAAAALDDMLWSRYQLFIQVLNHKTNVALNAMLGEAIQFAIGKTYVEQPTDFKQFVAFTDDLVMSGVFRLCFSGDAEVRDTPFVKTLARRQIPLHLGTKRLEAADSGGLDPDFEARLSALGLAKGDLIMASAISELVKEGPLPTLYRWDKLSKNLEIIPLSDRSSILGVEGQKFVSRIFRVQHYFVDRSKLEGKVFT